MNLTNVQVSGIFPPPWLGRGVERRSCIASSHHFEGEKSVFSKRKFALSIALISVIAAFAASAGTASAALPVNYNFLSAQTSSVLTGATPPSGANNWLCRPSAAHPRPIVLVHGTVENQKSNWSALAPELKNAGYCVYTFNYGDGLFTLGQFYGLDSMTKSGSELKSFVDKVRFWSGASKVDLVGHSQGGLLLRYYIQKLGGAAKVKNAVALAATNNGTTLSGFASLAKDYPDLASVFVFSWCKSCADQITGSAFINSVNAGGGTSPGVTYTNIATKYDEISTPYTTAFLTGSNVTNITVQDGCSKDKGEHLAISYDRRALWFVRKALDPSLTGTAPCVDVKPFIGG